MKIVQNKNDINTIGSSRSTRTPRVCCLNFNRIFPNYNKEILAGTAYKFELLAHQLKRHSNPKDNLRLDDRQFRAAFGYCPKVCTTAWLLIVDGWFDQPDGATKMRFL